MEEYVHIAAMVSGTIIFAFFGILFYYGEKDLEHKYADSSDESAYEDNNNEKRICFEYLHPNERHRKPLTRSWKRKLRSPRYDSE